MALQHRTASIPPSSFPRSCWTAAKCCHAIWARVPFQTQCCLQTLSAALQSYTSFCASPSRCWLCSLVPNEHSSVFQSGCGRLRTATTQRAERQSAERSFPFLQHHSSGKNPSQDRSGLFNHCSCPGGSCLAAPQGQHSIKSLE